MQVVQDDGYNTDSSKLRRNEEIKENASDVSRLSNLLKEESK